MRNLFILFYCEHFECLEVCEEHDDEDKFISYSSHGCRRCYNPMEVASTFVVIFPMLMTKHYGNLGNANPTSIFRLYELMQAPWSTSSLQWLLQSWEPFLQMYSNCIKDHGNILAHY